VCPWSNLRRGGNLRWVLSRTPRLVEFPAHREIALEVRRPWVVRERVHGVDELADRASL
jgi:hypothetical protein